jgi:acyl carrier protein
MAETITREAVEQRVVEALVEFGASRGDITREASFQQLDIDSLDLVELAQIVDEEYGVELKEEDLKTVKTVGQAIDLVAERSGSA